MGIIYQNVQLYQWYPVVFWDYLRQDKWCVYEEIKKTIWNNDKLRNTMRTVTHSSSKVHFINNYPNVKNMYTYIKRKIKEKHLNFTSILSILSIIMILNDPAWLSRTCYKHYPDMILWRHSSHINQIASCEKCYMENSHSYLQIPSRLCNHSVQLSFFVDFNDWYDKINHWPHCACAQKPLFNKEANFVIVLFHKNVMHIFINRVYTYSL